MNRAPLAVREEMSAARVHRTFVTLGLRHLCVVDSHNRVCGLISRKDLHSAVHDAEHEHETSGHHGHDSNVGDSGTGRRFGGPFRRMFGLAARLCGQGRRQRLQDGPGAGEVRAVAASEVYALADESHIVVDDGENGVHDGAGEAHNGANMRA